MKPFLFSDTFAKSFSVFIALFIAGTVVAWTGPTGTAPNNNTATPINQGSTVQVKTGALGTTGTFTATKVGSPEICLSSNLTSCITTWAQAISQGGGGGDNLGNHLATAALTMAGNDIANAGNIYTSNNYGKGLVGLYSDTRYQGVFAMGDSYKLTADGTSPGSLYGIAWTHSNIGGQSKAGLGHQALFMSNGVTQTAIGTGVWTSGVLTANGNLTTPIFYDQNDTSYYVDPHNISIVNQLRARFIYDQDNTTYYVDPASFSNLGSLTANNGITSYGPSGWAGYFVGGSGIYGQANGGQGVQGWSQSGWGGHFVGAYGTHTSNHAGYYSQLANSSWGLLTNGNTNAAGYYYNSDERLKKNITTLSDSLNKVLALRGVSYEWKDQTLPTKRNTEFGFIAQEVETVAPELVKTDEDGYKSVDYPRVVPLLVEAIKTQQVQIEALKADIEALKARQ